MRTAMLIFTQLTLSSLLVFLVMLVYANYREVRDPYGRVPTWEAVVGVTAAMATAFFGLFAAFLFIWSAF